MKTLATLILALALPLAACDPSLGSSAAVSATSAAPILSIQSQAPLWNESAVPAKGEKDRRGCLEGDCKQDCKAGGSCAFSCAGGDCKQSCAKGADCDFTCSGGDCPQVCAEKATCDFGCAGGDCPQTCHADAKDCDLGCTGGDCKQDCAGAKKCDRSCLGKGCK